MPKSHYLPAFMLLFLLLLLSAADVHPTTPQETSSRTTARPQRIEQISVIGNHMIRRTMILRALALEAGDEVSDHKIDKSIKRIRKLPGVEYAEIRVLPGAAADSVRLFVIITEEETRTLTPHLSRRLTNKWSVGVRFIDTNLGGRGERAYAALLFGGATIVEGGWSRPHSFRYPFLGIGVDISYTDHEYNYPDYQSLLLDDRLRRLEATASLFFNVKDLVVFFIKPGIDRVEVADSMLAGQGKAEVPSAPSGTFSTLELGVHLNTLRGEWYPTSGFRVIGARKDWGLFESDSEVKNFRYHAEVTAFFKTARLINSLHVRGVENHGEVPIWMLEHLGNVGTIRGLDFGLLSGEKSILGSAEIRIPLNFRDITDLGNPLFLVDFHVFVDSGACWSDPETLDKDMFHSGFGCGLNIIPYRRGLVIIDYAWRKDTSGMWQINVGTKF